MVEYEHYKIDDHSAEAEVPYIFHAGTLNQQKDGILGMIEAFGMAKQRLQKPIKYILTGNIDSSTHPVEIRKLIKQYQLEDSIEFVGYLFRDQVKAYLSKASLVISNRHKSKQDYYGFSTKVGEYLASGTPLITTRWGEAINWLKDGETAYIIEPENTEALADAIVRVFTNQEEARRIGKAGQDLCRSSFDYRNWSKPLVEFLKNLG
jgi:glycosyltransferase involved in cell wall biosynthesis